MDFIGAVSADGSIDTLISDIVTKVNANTDNNGVFVSTGWWSGHNGDYIGFIVKKVYESKVRIGGIIIDNNRNGQDIYCFTAINNSYNYHKLAISDN